MLIQFYNNWHCFVIGDLSSASEGSDNESDDSDSRDLSGYACRHCFTTSKNILTVYWIFNIKLIEKKDFTRLKLELAQKYDKPGPLKAKPGFFKI